MTVAPRVHIQVGPEDGPWLAKLLPSISDVEITVSAAPAQHRESQGPEPHASVLQEDVLGLLQKASLAARPLLEKFISDEVTTRQAVQVLGRGQTGYVRLYVPGPRLLGAYVVVEPAGSHATFRLPKDHDTTRYDHAFARKVKDDDPYGVRVRLTSRAAVAEAHRLGAEAYERVVMPSVSAGP